MSYAKTILKHLSVSKLVIAFVITSIIAISISFSRYKSNEQIHDIAKVAVMANDVSFVLGDTINGYPGNKENIYPILLTNKENGHICEVSQKFNITIKKHTEENIPITYALYEDESCTKLLSSSGDGVYEQANFTFSAGKEEQKMLYLKIDWPAEKNSDSYTFEIDYFKFDIIITQID